MQKAKCRFFIARHRRPVGASFFEQAESPVDIGAHEVIGTVYGPIHVAFRGEVNDGTRAMHQEHLSQHLTIADIAFHELVSRICGHRGEVGRVPSISQLVQIDDGRRLAGKPLQNKVGADEPGAARNQDCVRLIFQS